MNNVKASLLMVVSMALFAIEDAFVKRSSVYLPVGQILIMLGAGGFMILSLIAMRQGQRVLIRAALMGPVLVRNVAELVGTAGFVTALALIPLSTTAVILQAAPLLVTIGAALFLGEQVGWRRWSAIAVGLTGVLIILRPGMEGFQLEALWAVLGVVGLAIRDVATRRVPPELTTIQLSAWAFAAVIFAGLFTLGFGPPVAMPSSRTAIELCAALFFGLLAYSLLTVSIRSGDLAVVAPFRYSRAVFALGIGALVFNETPDTPMLIGAALIVGSGLYTLMREARVRRATRSSP